MDEWPFRIDPLVINLHCSELMLNQSLEHRLKPPRTALLRRVPAQLPRERRQRRVPRELQQWVRGHAVPAAGRLAAPGRGGAEQEGELPPGYDRRHRGPLLPRPRQRPLGHVKLAVHRSLLWLGRVEVEVEVEAPGVEVALIDGR